MTDKIYRYLALGDSYTIGEGVPLHESFPYQAVQILRSKGHSFNAPEIIAKTGWTTGELIEHLSQTKLLELYDFATLLIGVNNQYRAFSIEDYAKEFTFLLEEALRFTGGKSKHVMVMSIPHWQLTPFAFGRDKQKIEEEINVFNNINKTIANAFGVGYIDIAPGTQELVIKPELITTDQLHYSALEHNRWANAVVDCIVKALA